MSSKKKAAKRGKRYTAEEKQEVVDFVNKVNAEKGRGGQSDASKKFGISPLTISSWLKATGNKPKKRGRKAKAKSTATKGRGASTSIDLKLAELQRLHKEIASTEKRLDQLQAQFEKAKSSL